MLFPTIKKLTATAASDLVELFNRFQDNVINFAGAVNTQPQLQSIQLLNVTLKAGQNQIPHTLGKVLIGWSIIDIDNAARVFRYAPSNNTTLFLQTDVACQIALSVY